MLVLDGGAFQSPDFRIILSHFELGRFLSELSRLAGAAVKTCNLQLVDLVGGISSFADLECLLQSLLRPVETVWYQHEKTF